VRGRSTPLVIRVIPDARDLEAALSAAHPPGGAGQQQ
jgi:hypothetical protein